MGAPASLDEFLHQGRISEGLTAYAAPANNVERFSLATLQAIDGLQRFSVGFNRFGLSSQFARNGLPFLRAIIPSRETNTILAATPEAVGALFNDLRAALLRANATLADIDAEEFKVEINLTQARMDFDGDGLASDHETLVRSLGGILGFRSRSSSAAQEIVVHFDSADAMWLKGYTHFLIGVLDLLLAYNWRPVWDQCAHVIVLKPDPPPPIAGFTRKESNLDTWADLIAAVHELRLELIDPEGPRRARDAFHAMISCNRVCWQRILAETDDDREWLPAPQQTGPGGIKVSQAHVDGWQRVLDELDAIATGKKLLPHWRIKAGTGINVDKLVAAPPRLDLVLLIQGSALIPYLETGAISDVATWQTLMVPFGPGFARFALWSN